MQLSVAHRALVLTSHGLIFVTKQMNENGCPHLNDLKQNVDIVCPYAIISKYFVTCTTPEARFKKATTCFCFVCKSYGPRLHSCLHCIYFGCFSGHIQEHAKLEKHYLAIDLIWGKVLCFQCRDYVHYKEFLEIDQTNRSKVAKQLGINPPEFLHRSDKEVYLAQMNPEKRKIVGNSTIGLRGLINLGNSCFMSCIVQALTHTPLLTNYFLTENHVCQFKENSNMCLVCELTRLYQEFYSGNTAPLTLDRLLHLIWTHACHLAGYEQQDAHEFFMATLDVLHRHCKGPVSVTTGTCDCIIDKIFTGRLQSDVVCQACKGVSTTIDPFWDISLDLGASALSSRMNQSDSVLQKQSLSNVPTTLLDCLERFTQAEHLGPSAKIRCSQCDDYRESTKQLTMKKLPIVASFHLKRFEHSSCSDKKISTFIAFPEKLDMTPFMFYSRNRTSYSSNSNINNSNGPVCSSNQQADSKNWYSLFAVVNHSGSLDAGHYTAFVRQRSNHWFKCDDHIITKANLQEVLDSEGT
ncbi:hypothetical protein PR048_003297 [Dryococelus australis]|uniref:Ubiquitin carboxyl-terminal hydrolase n=1 Tax=Dryococelus australis TaxID=614101 RepID=A0ABQ9INZ9_9NEOP|nr:hypothetical protein PR048_003297 [Dryococelus australis]